MRTGVTIIGLGFVVARFGLFLTLFRAVPSNEARLGFAGILGTGLAIGGGAITALAAAQFALFVRSMKREERPHPRLTWYLSLILAFSVSAAGVLLAIYLLG